MEVERLLAQIILRHRDTPGGLMPLLQDIQEDLGYIPPDSMPGIATAMNLSVAEVHGVISFYHDFRTEPGGRHTVQVCCAESCQAVGARELAAHANKSLGVDFGETTADGAITLERVYCLGNCACSPAIRIDDDLHAEMDAKQFDALCAALRVGADLSAPAESADNLVQAESADKSAPTGTKYYMPADSTAGALGADRLAQLIAAQAPEAELLRNGSRGAFWLEPLLEIERGDQRVGFGPLNEFELEEILALDPGAWDSHPRYLGPVDELDWFTAQQRVTFARSGLGDPLCLEHYLSRHGFDGLEHAVHLPPEDIVDEVMRSGLRGRGGAAFPAGIKLQTVLQTQADQKYIVCNADEGDSGTFADRLLMESDPYQLIEGMVIAGVAVGATKGYIYLRSEYPRTWDVLHRAIVKAEAAGYLGDGLCDSDKTFHLELRLGAGSYICGEETALLDSLEGRRGIVRAKPPLPAVEGLWSKPTVVNNVLTLAAMSSVLADGAEAYHSYGVERSRGTLAVQLAGNVRRGGLLEIPYGVSLRQVVEEYGGGTRSGRPVRAIQCGGPLGAYLPESQWDAPLEYEAFAQMGAMLGHGGIVVFDDTVDMAGQARFAMDFCAAESCGKCTPCRIGSVRGREVIDRIIARDNAPQNIALLRELCDTMEQGSLCAMGGLTPLPVRSALDYFAEDFS